MIYKTPWLEETCAIVVRIDSLFEEYYFLVAYVISHILALCCLNFCVLICERVLWFDNLCEIIEYCNCTTWEVWCTHMSKNDQGWLMCMFGMSIQVAFDEGGVAHQSALSIYFQEVGMIEEIPHIEWKECPNIFLQILSFLLQDWKKCNRR